MHKQNIMPRSLPFVTAEELERFPDDDYRYELVEGRIIRMSPVGYQHGKVVIRLAFLLQQHLQNRDLGVLLTEVGFQLASRPDTVRAPDIAFIRQARIPANPEGFWNGPPDLAVEVLSPEDRPADIRVKVEEYLSRGVALVVVVNPTRKTVQVSRPSRPSLMLRGNDDVVDLSDVIADFRCTLRDVFE